MRHDCGFHGITREQCEARGCCFAEPNPPNVSSGPTPWCFQLPRVSHKRCDPHVVNGTVYCAPALFVPAFGKCGTNAIGKYLKLHPHVKELEIEAPFDPRTIRPYDLMRTHGAHMNVTADARDPTVWIMRDPSTTEEHTSLLAERLVKAYPSSSVALGLCDPLSRAYRWFRFVLSLLPIHELQRQTGGNAPTRLPTSPCLATETRISPAHFSSWVADEAGWDLATLFEQLIAQPIRQQCRSSGYSRAAHRMFDALPRSFCGYAVNHTLVRHECLHWMPSAPSFNYGEYVRGWQQGGAGRLSVTYMESWASDGEAYVRELLSYLRLDPSLFPWARVDFGEKIFSAESSDHHHGGGSANGGARDAPFVFPPQPPSTLVPPSEEHRVQLVKACCELRRITNSTPPWAVCTGLSCGAL